jgi:hypothetical protein
MPGKFSDLVLEKDKEDQLNRSCEKWGSGEKYPTYRKRRKANWIGHILRRNCLLKHIIEGRREEEIKVT